MALRKFLDRLAPLFHKGGKYEKYYALYEAVDTIFYSPASVTKSAPHVRDGIDLKRVMITVWLAVFPAMFYGMYNLGFQANTALAAGGAELEGWRAAAIAALAGNDPGSIWDCFWYGAVFFVPIYAVTFVVGGFGRYCSPPFAGTRSTRAFSSPRSCSHSPVHRRFRCGWWRSASASAW